MMTEAQLNAQAVALAGMVPQILRRRIAGRVSDHERKRLQSSLRAAEKAYREVQKRYPLAGEARKGAAA